MSKSLAAFLGRMINRSNLQSAPRRKRKRYLVDHDVQFRITRHLFGILLVATILALGNFYIIAELSDFYAADSVGLEHDGWREQAMAWGYGLAAIVNNCLIILLLSLFYSHRIAGPAVQIVKALKQVNEGDLQTCVRLRKGDYLQEVATAVNDAIRHWDGSLDEIDRAIQSLKAHPGTIEKATLDRKLAAIEVAINRYKVRNH